MEDINLPFKSKKKSENTKVLASQLTNITNLIGFNFKQQGGIPSDNSPATALVNTNLFRSLMNTCNTMGGGTVSIPDGTFYFCKYNSYEVIHALDNVNVIGLGAERSILKVIAETSTSGGHSFFYNKTNVNNVNYRDFTVDMYNEDMTAYDAGGKAFYFQQVKNSTFKNLRLKGTPSTGMGIDHLTNVVIDNVNCYECGRLWGAIPIDGVTFDPSNPTTSNPFPGGAGIGIGTGGSVGENFKIVNCTTELCGHFGIFVEHQKIYDGNANQESKDIIIANNTSRNNRFSGFGLRGGTRITMSGNQSYGNGCFGLSIDSKGNTAAIVTLKDSKIIGNMFNGNGLDGVSIDGCCIIDGLDMKANSMLKNGQYGVSLGKYNYSDITDTLQQNIVLSGNTMYGNGIDNIYQIADRMLPFVNLKIESNTYITPVDPSTSVIVKDNADPNVQYYGIWTTSTNSARYNGSSKYTVTSGSHLRFEFNGTGFKLYTPTSTAKGKISVVVDGGAPVIVDLYTASTMGTHKVYELQGLTSGVHEVLVTCLGTKNTNSTDVNVSLDALTVTGGDLVVPSSLVTVEETNASITYSGTWSTSSGGNYSGGATKYTIATGAYMQFSFTGTKIVMRTAIGNNKGIMQVFIDGVPQDIDCYSVDSLYNQVVFSAGNLDGTTHTIKVQCNGTKNALSTDKVVSVDSFAIYGGNIV